MSKIEELYKQTRNHPVYQNLVPLESVLSYPIPSISNEKQYLHFFVFHRSRGQKGTPRAIFRPYLKWTILYPTGQIVEYLDLRHTEGKPITPTSEQIGVSPHPLLEALDFEEAVKLRSDFFEAIENLMNLYKDRDQVTNNLDEKKEFLDLYEVAVEPELRTYYRELNTDFFAWLTESAQ